MYLVDIAFMYWHFIFILVHNLGKMSIKRLTVTSNARETKRICSASHVDQKEINKGITSTK